MKKKVNVAAERDIGDEIEEALEDTSEGEKQTMQLIKLVLHSKPTLFHDQFKNPFIAPNGTGSKIMNLRSREFKLWLGHLAWSKLGMIVHSSVNQTVASVLEGRAVHEAEEITLEVRLAQAQGALWYDLGAAAVCIAQDGWSIVREPPILFRRLNHQQPQVEPSLGGDMSQLFEFIPTPKEEHERLLLLCWLVVSMLQGFPHPALTVHGPQGSRKSTLFKLLRRLVDPSVLDLLAPNTDIREFVQLASHHYFLPLDNLSTINPLFSDALCRAITGEGFSKRELYSDDDDIIYSFRRVIAINGINNVVDRPDLLERSLIISLERPQEYEEDKVVLSRFEAERPKLLGALFDTVVKTLHIAPTIQELSGMESYRMADFARLGCAAAVAMGYTVEDFVIALKTNLEQQNAEAIDASLIAQIIIAFMEGKTQWSGTPSRLLEELKALAEQLKLDIKAKSFPKAANWLWKRMEHVKTNLHSCGISFQRDKDGERLITLIKKEIPIDTGPDGEGYSFEDLERQAEIIDSPRDTADSKDSIF